MNPKTPTPTDNDCMTAYPSEPLPRGGAKRTLDTPPQTYRTTGLHYDTCHYDTLTPITPTRPDT